MGDRVNRGLGRAVSWRSRPNNRHWAQNGVAAAKAMLDLRQQILKRIRLSRIAHIQIVSLEMPGLISRTLSRIWSVPMSILTRMKKKDCRISSTSRPWNTSSEMIATCVTSTWEEKWISRIARGGTTAITVASQCANTAVRDAALYQKLTQNYLQCVTCATTCSRTCFSNRVSRMKLIARRKPARS